MVASFINQIAEFAKGKMAKTLAEEEPLQVSYDISSYSQCGGEEITARLLVEYLQLVLYLRSQIPEPIQLMRRKLQRRKILSVNSANFQTLKQSEVQYNNKCTQLLKTLDDLKDQLKKLVEKSESIEAVIGIGSTPVSIKEAFTLTSHIKDCLGSDGESCSTERLNSHVRKFCMLMVQSSLCTGGVLPLTNTRLFLRISNKVAAERCTPWPNLKWSSKKHKINTTINFHSSNPSTVPDSSFEASAHLPDGLDQDKENRMPCANAKFDECNASYATKIPTLSADSKCDDSSDPSISTKVNSRRKRLSTTEVLEGVLAENDSVSSEEESHSSVDSSQKSVWLELPILIKGFKC